MTTDIDTALEALGDATRRRIISRLASGPLDVSALSDGMPVGRTAISMHLRVLKEAGLVRDRSEGTRRVYSLEPDALQRLRNHLDWYWERSLAAFQEAAEARGKDEPMFLEQEIVVSKSVTVAASLAVAFDVFVEHRWWPVTTHHIAETPGVTAVLEPFAGGRWYEVDAAGVETDWGRVLAWQPPYRILLTWQVDPDWRYTADPELGSEIEITFTEVEPGSTRVDLTHRHLQRYGEQTERMRRILDEKGGDPLDAFAAFVQRTVVAQGDLA